MDNNRYVRYTNEQVEALEHLYSVCPKPSSSRRQQLIEECPILANIEPKQIKVWFQNRRCREKQRKESTRLAAVNVKLTSMNKLLLEENRRLTKHTSELAVENSFLRQQIAKLEAEKSLNPTTAAATASDQRGRGWGSLLSDKLEPAAAAGKQKQSISSLTRRSMGLAMTDEVTSAQPSLLHHHHLHHHQHHALGLRASASGSAAAAAAGGGPPPPPPGHLFAAAATTAAAAAGGGGGAGPSGVSSAAAAAAAAAGGAAHLVAEPGPNSAITSLIGMSPAWERTKAQILSDPSISGVMTVAAEELLAEFLAKATGTALDWVHLAGTTQPNLELLGIISIARGDRGVAARACGLVQVEAEDAREVLKQRSTWLGGCRRCTVLGSFKTADRAGNIEYVYSQMYSPTTLAAPRDFCTLRFTSKLPDGSTVVCERSLSTLHGGARVPEVPPFVRAEMLPSGFLVRPSPDGAGSIVIIVDHHDLKAWLVPEVLRSYYESPPALAYSSTMEALRHLKRMGAVAGEGSSGKAQHQAQWRTIAQRLTTGFNEAVNGFADDGWEPIVTDGANDVSIVARTKTAAAAGGGGGGGGASEGSSSSRALAADDAAGVVSARASMLLQNVPPAQFIKFLRDNRPQWVDPHKSLEVNNQMLLESRISGAGGSQGLPPVPLGGGPDDEELLELVRLDSSNLTMERGWGASGAAGQASSSTSYLLQLCSGVNTEPAGAALTHLIFAPVDATGILSDTAPLLPSGFSVIPLDQSEQAESGSASLPTLDLASSLDGERCQASSRAKSQEGASCSSSSSAHRGILTLAFQFPYEPGKRDEVAATARSYARAIVVAVQRIAVALVPSPAGGPSNDSLPTSDAYLLVRRLLSSYRLCMGTDLVRAEGGDVDSLFKAFWSHPEAIVCCLCKLPSSALGPLQRRDVELQHNAELKFANQAGLDMLETTLQGLQQLSWSKTLDAAEGNRPTSSCFAEVIQQGFACLPAGVNMSSSGRPARYERGLAWRVLDNDQTVHCIGIIYFRWSFLTIKL